jgi:hypothetical protein
MNMFNDAYAAVPLGEDIIKEYVMYTYDVPVNTIFTLFSTFKITFFKNFLLRN